MTYEEVIQKLNLLLQKGSIYGTERVSALLQTIGSPDLSMRVIHVAGTNGKGSTSTMIASALHEAGYKVGLFTSPAVFDRRECYQIDGKYVSEEKIARSFAPVIEVSDCTSFETEFCCAMKLFQNEGCDFAVIECGCGGKNDATNGIRRKDLAVITSISLDHTALLGDTLDKIASEKVGIVKDCPLVTGRQSEEVEKVFAPYSPVYAKEYEGELSLQGSFQKYNAGIAEEALKLLKIEPKFIKKGLKNATISGRFERISDVILDGAHNENAAIELKKSLLSEGITKATFFIGMFQDKAVDRVLEILLPLAKKVVVLQAPLPRGMKVEELAKKAKAYCSDVQIGTDEIIKKTLSEAGSKVACGSFSILSKVRRWIDG